MNDKYCPFLESNGSWFGASYRCKITQESISTGSTIYENFCANYESTGYSRCPHMKDDRSSSSCFLTSACVEAKGLPDDCYELTALRNFRDNWLKAQPCGECVIAEYYAVAPAIVDAIHALPDAQERFSALYDELVVPCVRFIEQGEMEAAYRLYRETTEGLKRKFINKAVC